MPSLGQNDACPCHSGRKYKRCCRLVLEGQRAPSPEALMRSRYSAYALGHSEHILRTTHPEGPHWRDDREAWLSEVRQFSASVRFERLEVRSSLEQGDRGIVDFVAHLASDGGRTAMAERSLFLKVGGAWRYHSGVRLPS